MPSCYSLLLAFHQLVRRLISYGGINTSVAGAYKLINCFCDQTIVRDEETAITEMARARAEELVANKRLMHKLNRI